MAQKETLHRILRNDPRIMRRNYRRFSSHVDAFNYARKSADSGYCRKLDLAGVNFAGASLPEINLELMDFGHATLDGANFEGANLRKSRFDYTTACDVNFRGADLRDCSGLYKIDYAQGANFENADLRGTSFRVMPENGTYDYYLRGLLEEANFSGTKITPEQREQLVTWFGMPEEGIERRFVVVPRGKYLGGPFEYFYEKGMEAHEKARNEGRIVTEKLNGDSLEYAVVPIQGNEDMRDHAGYAFSLVRSSNLLTALFGSRDAQYRGDWLYFVFDDVPEQFREFAAVHEFGEREGGSHKEATIMEYERAKSKGMLGDYLSWIVAEHPNKLIGDALNTFAEEEMVRLPDEVVEVTGSIMPKSTRAWKRKQENRKNGFPFDIWKLAWKGLPDDEIVKRLGRKGYDATTNLVEQWREQMEVPGYEAIQKLTYLEPI